MGQQKWPQGRYSMNAVGVFLGFSQDWGSPRHSWGMCFQAGGPNSKCEHRKGKTGPGGTDTGRSGVGQGRGCPPLISLWAGFPGEGAGRPGDWLPHGKHWKAGPDIRSLGPRRGVGSGKQAPRALTHGNHDVPHVRELFGVQEGRQLLPCGHRVPVLVRHPETPFIPS